MTRLWNTLITKRLENQIIAKKSPKTKTSIADIMLTHFDIRTHYLFNCGIEGIMAV
jgi:hypothetical protein